MLSAQELAANSSSEGGGSAGKPLVCAAAQPETEPRGTRPPGSPRKLPLPEAPPTQAAVVGGKRPRGRPCKVPLPEVHQQEDDAAAAAAEEASWGATFGEGDEEAASSVMAMGGGHRQGRRSSGAAAGASSRGSRTSRGRGRASLDRPAVSPPSPSCRQAACRALPACCARTMPQRLEPDACAYWRQA